MASWQFSTKFFVYGLIGGFYHSKRFAPRTKYIWLLLNVVAFFITIILGCYGYWITTDQKTVADKAFILATASINLFSIVVVPVITYQYSHDLETILDFVEIEWSKPTINESRARRREARKYLIYAIAMDSTVALVVITLHPALMLWYGPSKLHSLQHYIYPVPHIRRIDTFLAYFSITSVHCACAVLIVSVLVVVPPFLMILAFEFYVAFAINGDLLQKFQAQVRSDFEECHEKYSYVESAQHLQAFRQDVAYLQLRLLRGLSKASRDHQDLRRKIKIIKPFIEVFFSLFLPWFVMASVSLTYVYLSQKLTLLQKIKTLGILTGWTIMMFSFTHVGKLFDDMEDEFFENVSGFPWYYLEPKQRKTFYIFLNQTMHPVRFYAFTMYSLVPITSLNCLKLIYSFGNLLFTRMNVGQVK